MELYGPYVTAFAIGFVIYALIVTAALWLAVARAKKRKRQHPDAKLLNVAGWALLSVLVAILFGILYAIYILFFVMINAIH